LANLKAPDRPPDKHEKAAGKAGTFRSGAFHSLAAIFTYYGNAESGASTKLLGDAL
jgi:hypothetical protein